MRTGKRLTACSSGPYWLGRSSANLWTRRGSTAWWTRPGAGSLRRTHRTRRTRCDERTGACDGRTRNVGTPLVRELLRLGASVRIAAWDVPAARSEFGSTVDLVPFYFRGSGNVRVVRRGVEQASRSRSIGRGSIARSASCRWSTRGRSPSPSQSARQTYRRRRQI